MIIREFLLFYGLSKEVAQKLIDIMQEESYPSGTVLFQRGDPADFLYILSSGKLECTLPGKLQTRKVLAEEPGQIVGWSSLVERETYSTDVVCTQDSEVTKMYKKDVETILRSHPADGRLFYKHLSTVIAQRLLTCHETLAEAQATMDF
jgi:CRP-like cAMP-binding protein